MGTRGTPWSFDPVALGGYECDAWVGYYRRDWRLVLTSAVGMVRVGFGLGRTATLRGAWFVLRANQAWAPYPTNDPAAARRYMERFYTLVATAHGLPVDPATAATLEVDWWHEHRVLQHEPAQVDPAQDDPAQDEPGRDDDTKLVAALALLYAYVYSRSEAEVLPAARDRALAMRVSDDWVAAGCDRADPRVDEERRLLVRSYANLLDVVSAA